MSRAVATHRVLFAIVLVAAVVLLAVGGLIAVRAWARAAGPADVTRDYFAALAGSDAPTALTYGPVPPGADTLLTSTVLREQQNIAPIRDIVVRQTARAGNQATVDVSYDLAFPGGPVAVHSQVSLNRYADEWHLARSAVRTALQFSAASERASMLGGAVPTDDVTMFPGAVPIRLDTAYLQQRGHVELGTGAATIVTVGVSTSGVAAARAAVSTTLRGCLARAAAGCPLPVGRAVPGTLHGTLAATDLTVRLTGEAAGRVSITGTAKITGSYQQLSYDNRRQTRRGRLEVSVDALAYAVTPLRPFWTAT